MLNIINTITWSIALSLIFTTGIYLTYKLKFIQLKIPSQIKSLIPTKNSKINSFETLSITLASKIGVGSISGIALAIYLGGPGVIFWMWISGIITSANTYVEAKLGKKYQQKKDNNYYGGPSYYISKALNNKKLAMLYASIVIIAYVFGFIPIQSNTIVKAITEISSINNILIAFIICLSAYIIIYKDMNKIAKFSSIIVPIMTIIYLILGFYITIININKIPTIIELIIKNAFNFKSGLLGFLSTIIIGIQRGLFASEAGIGTAAIATASSEEDAHKQALSQVFGIHFTIFIICNITAFIILTSSYENINILNPNGIEITINSFNTNFGKLGSIILCIITSLFAFSTIISCYYYTESSLKYIFPKINKTKIHLHKIFIIIILFLGTLINSYIIWKIVDILLGIMVIINIYSIKKITNTTKL